ncbi:MAG TPA: choice-of-anchor tandem repeat GloVer-containing protein [Terriglobales bacterium]|nr:choice-of-anchor tandem repeat GloVer-containing protein [Terriglobales bacterium]
MASETVLYAFSGASDGAEPAASLIADTAGNLYGTTYTGGSGACFGGCGVVFELERGPGGAWRESVIYSFSGPDGASPVSNLIFDSAGNLYGTTYSGGAQDLGVVFELTPSSRGWQQSVLYNFGSATHCRDGTSPAGGVILDVEGNLYGTTQLGGTEDCGFGAGVVFELSPGADGPWSETVLHRFKGTDGSLPEGNLVFDQAGNLYGAAYYGGTEGSGTVFMLSPQTNGSWKETVLHDFQGIDGENPTGSLVFNSSDNLYGTASAGGSEGMGLVFELEASHSGKEESISFTGVDGAAPWAGVIFDGAGNLYGTARSDGENGHGVVYELTPTSAGLRRRTFSFSGADGSDPTCTLLVDPKGNVYGTTRLGGDYNQGVVFEVSQ